MEAEGEVDIKARLAANAIQPRDRFVGAAGIAGRVATRPRHTGRKRKAAQARCAARHAPGVVPVQRRKARVNEVCSA